MAVVCICIGTAGTEGEDQEGGTTLAAILFGEVNPSGKLPTTFLVARKDYPDFGHFPGHDGVVKYDEGIYVGYRYFDKKNIKPIFPFGYGLPYTTLAFIRLLAIFCAQSIRYPI